MKFFFSLLMALLVSCIGASPSLAGNGLRWSHAEFLPVVPQWLIHTLVALVVASGVAAAFIVLLRLQVRRKTVELTAQADERKKIEQTLFFINESGSRHRADELLTSITAYLGNCLDVEYVFVSQLLPGNHRARTRGLYIKGEKGDELEYDFEGTPCANVIGRELCIYQRDVIRLFPQDRLLVEMQAEGYAAVPLWDYQGTGIGLLGIVSRRPLQNTPLISTLLQIVSARVAQEIEAMNHLGALQLKNFTIENMNDAVYWISPEAKIWEVNAAVSSMLGYSREQLLSMSIPDIDPEFPLENWPAHWEELKAKGGLQFETVHRSQEGCIIPVEITANYCTYNGTEYNCAIVRDITERKRMEEALEHRLAVLTEPLGNLSDIRFEDLFDLEELQKIQDSFAEATGVASLITDANGRPITQPSNFCQLCSGIIRQTEKGRANCMCSDAQLVHIDPDGPTLQPCLSAGLWDGGAGIHVGGHHVGNWLIGQVLDEGCDVEKLMAYAKEIGADEEQYREALAQVTRMPLAQFQKVCQSLFHIAGQLSRMAIQNVQQAQHISERKRSEELLLEYRQVIECSHDMICVIDRDYRYRLANGAFLDFRNLRHDNVVGHPACEVLGPELFALIKPHIDACLSGENVNFEEQHPSPDKGLRTLAVAYSPIEDSTGRFGVACVIRDQTENRHLEQQLRQSQKMEAIGLLAGGVAHDFNNILTVIVGYGHMLTMDDELSERQKEEVEQIIAASEKASQLTRGLLAFSRKQLLAPKNVNLNEVVQNTKTFLLRVIGEDIELKFTTHESCLSVFADNSQIDQMLLNLATNARDAMPNGGMLAIETCSLNFDAAYAQSHGYGEPGRYACLMVSDTGVGMDKETRERIFEPFFSTKEIGKGTGLGMAIVYGIVKQHKGFINVYSEPGEGTSFKIYLPVVEDGGEGADAGALPEPPRGGSETILVAEDDPGVSRMVQLVLEKFGYRVILAQDGGECVAKFLAHQDEIGMILMDMIMPGKNGKEAFEEIRAIRPGAKVLYSSGYTADFIQSRGVIDEGVDLIMKPVEPAKLLQKVREVLDR